VEMTRKFNNCKDMEIWTESVQSAVRVRISAWNGVLAGPQGYFRIPGPFPSRLSGLAICRIAESNAGCDRTNLCGNLRAARVRVCEMCGYLKLALNTIFLRGLKF
jgi:hypothetical protein